MIIHVPIGQIVRGDDHLPVHFGNGTEAAVS